MRDLSSWLARQPGPGGCAGSCAGPSVGSMRWIVDGMNVIGSRPDGWWRDRRGAMAGLVERLDRWAAGAGEEVTVVFEQPPRPPIEASMITVGYAPAAAPNSADDEIVRLVNADDRPSEITVVTSDGPLTTRVKAEGAAVFAAKAFRNLIDP